MAYSRETLEKFGRLANNAINQATENLENIHVHISFGNKKIGHVYNVSLMPVITCKCCEKCECRNICYDIKACLQYKNVMTARAENTALAMNDTGRFFGEIAEQIARVKNPSKKFFRRHVGGDILNAEYFAYIVEIAEWFDDWRFWTYTKDYQVVNNYIKNGGKIPSNLSIMFSEWRGFDMDNPYGFGEFRVVFKGEAKPKGHYCPGNCNVCKRLNRGCLTNETTYCNEH